MVQAPEMDGQAVKPRWRNSGQWVMTRAMPVCGGNGLAFTLDNV